MSPTAALTSPFEEAACVRIGADDCRTLADTDLLALAASIAAAQRAADTAAAVVAGEIARRSASAGGLAQRLGHRTAIELVRVTTGATGRDAAVAVRVGTLDPSPVTEALGDGSLSVAAADAIVSGLGAPSAAVTADELGAAAMALCAEDLDPDRLFRRAREVRASLDLDSVAEREATMRAARGVRFHRRREGMSRLTWDMDPETAAAVSDVFDRATSPRRGGPRFVDPSSAEQAAAIAADDRTLEQFTSDVFTELLRQGAAADSSLLLRSGAPQVRVHVMATDLAARTGAGRIEGQPEPVSIATVERLACAGGVTDITFLDGQPLDVGREQRLYTARQRVALAARDGGCRWPNCGRPPSWTEAHHIHHWARDGGRTDVADGVLLCRHHHLQLHNGGWDIERNGADYALVPPADVDPARVPRPMAAPLRLPTSRAVASTRGPVE